MSAARKNEVRRLEQRASRFRGILLQLAMAMAGTSVLVCSLVGGVIHLYATFLAFHASGYVAAVFTFAIPFFAELYWIAVIWSETGVFWHGLTVASIAYLALCIMAIIAGIVAAIAPD